MNKKIGAYADEVQGTTGTGNEASTVTTPISGRIGTEKNETAQVNKKPVTETTNAETGSQSNDSKQSGTATEFSKHDDIIQVTNESYRSVG